MVFKTIKFVVPKHFMTLKKKYFMKSWHFSKTQKMLCIRTRPYPHADNKMKHKRRMIFYLHFNVYHLQRESLLVCILQPRLANKLVEVTV